ncbi:hypothetical protein TDB9533_03399 [Thalassocella blandensis]|nr:hypothetical protein TDB9533_03399 [Thalassocella blandensis]
MSSHTHGFSIGIERYSDEIFLSLKAVGKLNHQDYKKITPMIDAALHCVNDPKVKVLFDASDFDGWELRAAWDDFTLGLKYNNRFEKVAIFGHKKWHEYGAKIAAWFISGEVEAFQTQEDAIEWLKNKPAPTYV